MSNGKLNITKNNSTNTIKMKPTINNNTISKNKLHYPMNQYANSYNLILSLSIIVPLIFFFLIMFIYYLCKKRKKIKNQKENYNLNTTNKEKNQNKKSYNRIMNTSGINNINPNENNLSEIKVQNMKEEMNNIINNNTGSSSGRRKREKRKIGEKKEKNINEFDNKEGQKEMQNEIKEQIKQFVIDEHNNNNE